MMQCNQNEPTVVDGVAKIKLMDMLERQSGCPAPKPGWQMFKDQSVYQQDDAVTADPYMDASRQSVEKLE